MGHLSGIKNSIDDRVNFYVLRGQFWPNRRIEPLMPLEKIPFFRPTPTSLVPENKPPISLTIPFKDRDPKMQFPAAESGNKTTRYDGL